ncbi:uncharacterized protein LOC129313896 [Prosopis cineraria]|uniref:uncharacterized protein LOC129313896 n=1 Tax=Prosopis cineraria TaxID=364024 RepID=UPI00240FCE06|nr:uncharacterized protein LOC129313896 [Prosopis cineraria]
MDRRNFLPQLQSSKAKSNGLPDKGYDDEDDDDEGFMRGNNIKEDLENGKNKVNKPISRSPVSSKISYALWKLVAKEWNSVREIWKKKKQNMQAEKVVDFLVEKDDSWTHTKHGDPRTEVFLPVIQPSNVAATRKAMLDKTSSSLKPLKCNDYPPLLLAASTGIVEIVERIIKVHPDAVSHISQTDEQNVLHVAIKHRQKKIYKLLKKYKALKGLGSHITIHNRTLLHQVARMDYYDGGNQPGVVFQLQEELHWFEVLTRLKRKVKRIVPCPYQLYCNDDKLTARELFDLEHSEMLKEAQQWIKETAQSCSAVSVLVATVVFAAAYTVPGGTNDNGVPVFLNSPLFLFFTIMDVVGLASSLISRLGLPSELLQDRQAPGPDAPFNLARDTTIHVAARSSDDPSLVRELQYMLQYKLIWLALRKGMQTTTRFFTKCVFCKQVNMVDAVVGNETRRS